MNQDRWTEGFASAGDRRRLAVFDFDGTLTTGDSLLPFLYAYGWRRLRLPTLAMLSMYAVAYTLRVYSARSFKQKVLKTCLSGEPQSRIEEHAERFIEDWLLRRLRPEGIRLLHAHLDAGDRVIILSASPNLYVPILARKLGVHEVVCTRVRCDDGVCVGEIIGDNCKGKAKVAMLTEYLGQAEAPDDSYSYGNARSDLPVLRWARNGFLWSRGAFRRVRPARRFRGFRFRRRREVASSA